MWDGIFSAVNIGAMIAWIILILLPRRAFLLALVLYLGVGVLCLVYTVAIISVMGGFVDAVPADWATGATSFTTIEGVREIFGSDGGVVVGWTHYLAFDLFIGLWIARDADAKGFNRFIQAPILLLTFMLGPIGLFIWLIIREKRARSLGRWS